VLQGVSAVGERASEEGDIGIILENNKYMENERHGIEDGRGGERGTDETVRLPSLFYLISIMVNVDFCRARLY
jgi:hypothetical protein